MPDLLTLATAAMPASARSLCAISQWGRLHPLRVRRALGFVEGERDGAAAMPMPAATTLHYVFKRLDVARFDAALAAYLRAAG